MRIYFAPCGIALGHAGRMLPVARTFQGRGHSVFFSTYGEAVPFVRKAGFPVSEVPAIRMFEKEDGTFNFRRTLSASPRAILNFSEQVAAEVNLIEHFKPDVVMSDSRLSSVLAARMMRITSVLVLHQLRIMIPHVKPITRRYKLSIKSHTERLGLEMFGGLWRLSQVIVVPDFPSPYTIAKANVVPSKQYIHKLRLVGPIIPKFPGTLPPADELKRELGFDDRPLIFAAISGTTAEKMLISRRLVELFRDFPDSYNIVVTRGLSDVKDAVGNGGLLSRNPRLRIYNWIDDRYKYLKACDLLVTRGGHNTVSEAIYYGKPMIVIPTPGHSEHQGIAESLAAMNLAIVQQQNSLCREGLLEGVQTMTESSVYRARIDDAQRYASRFNAVESIYRIVGDVLKKG
jgi:UDP:flavonoid glycosyltransferase YjiC (YdhE family)